MNLPIGKIRPNPDQPRKRFEPAALEELASSIRELGVVQPIAVREDGDGYLIIAGERRWRAAQEVGLSEIPAVVLDVDDSEELFVRSVAENVNRADMTVIEEADAYQRMVDQGHSVERIAKMLGKRPQDIRWKLDLAALDPAIRAVVATGQIPRDLAWYLAQVSPTRQREVVRKWSDGEFPTQQAAHAYCEAVKLTDSQEFMFEIEQIPEVTKRQQRARLGTRNRLEALGRAMILLDEIFEKEDERMALDLGSDAANLREQMELLHQLVGRLRRRAIKVEQLHNAGIGQSSLLP